MPSPGDALWCCWKRSVWKGDFIRNTWLISRVICVAAARTHITLESQYANLSFRDCEDNLCPKRNKPCPPHRMSFEVVVVIVALTLESNTIADVIVTLSSSPLTLPLETRPVCYIATF